MKLLVVEDDAETADPVAQGLRELGHGVDVACHGRDGLFLATDGDLLSVGRSLPGLDGLALVKTLRSAAIQTPVPFGIQPLHAGQQPGVESAGGRRRTASRPVAAQRQPARSAGDLALGPGLRLA